MSPTIFIDSPRSPGREDFAVAVLDGTAGVYTFPAGNYVGPAEQIVQDPRTVLWRFDVRDIGCPGRYGWVVAMLSESNRPRDRAPDEGTALQRGDWRC